MAPKKHPPTPVAEVTENNSGIETDQPIDTNNNNNFVSENESGLHPNNNEEVDETTTNNNNNNNNNDESNNNVETTTPVIVKHQLVLNDPTTKAPLVSSREKRILACKVSEISHGLKFLLMKFYTHDKTLPPIVFNISNEQRVTAFREFYGDNIPWEDIQGNESVLLFDFSDALTSKAYFEFLEIDKLQGSSSASTIDYLRTYCTSATHVIKPKWSQDNTKIVSQPYPNLIGITKEEVEFCIRDTDGNINVRPWYTEWINSDKPHVPNSYKSPSKAAQITSSSSEFISPTAGGGAKRKFEF